MKKLFFIDGIDGAGKTSLIQELLKRPAPRGCSWYQTVEPIIPPGSYVTPGIAQALHYNLDRRLHLERLSILPDDTLIVCDRGPLSTAAYQGGVQGVHMSDLASLHNMIVEDLRLTFDFHNIILHVPLAEAYRRVTERDKKLGEDEVAVMAEAWSTYTSYYVAATNSRIPHKTICGAVHAVDADRPMNDLVNIVYNIIEQN